MERKTIKMASIMLVFVLAAGLLAGCGKKEGSSSETINIFVWTEYVPDSVFEKFEKETGIHCNVSTYSSNEDMLAKVKSESGGTYDLVLPSDYMVEQLIAQDMLMELDQSQLTNLKNINKAYLDQPYDPGNKYSVPYQGGVAAIAVNTAKVEKEIASYDDLFDPSLSGSIVALDDYRAVIGMTARSMGYSMNESDRQVLEKIQEKLLLLKSNIKLYDSDSPKSALISGDCNVGFIWSAEIAMSMAENPDIEVVYPKEGPYVFMDNWNILKGSKHFDAAMKFINFMLESETAQMVSEEFPYLCPNEAAVQAMGAGYSENPAKNPPEDVIAGGEYVSNLDTDTLAFYDEMWTKLKK